MNLTNNTKKYQVMRQIYIGLNKKKNHGCCVYHDTSLQRRVRLGNGKVVERRHDCWRADVSLVDCNGVRRIRRRFKDRDEALAWLGIYK